MPVSSARRARLNASWSGPLVRQYTDGKISFTIRNKRVDTKAIAKQPYIRHTHHIVPTLTAA